MRKHITTFLVWVLLGSTLLSQNLYPHRTCGYDSLLAMTKSSNPDWYNRITHVYNHSLAAIQDATLRNGEDLYTIPVIVHIVWKEEDGNLSDQRIQSQIEVLNEDFRRLNRDAGQLRSIFSTIAADANIEFKLIETIRVQTDTTFAPVFDWANLKFYYPDHVKQSKNGGSDPYPIQSFLNIWVCPIEEDQLFGYTYPPAGLPGWLPTAQSPRAEFDGVVINYKAFGRNPEPFFDEDGNPVHLSGRVLTHEVGHYLGLQHTWGDPLITEPGCEVDDGLSDTPNLAFPSDFDCNLTKNTCIDEVNDLPDMIENFMDFTSERCKNTFTQQQVDLMRHVLEIYRPLLRIHDVKIEDGQNFLLYPNPSDGFVHAAIHADQMADYTIRVRNISGHLVDAVIQENPSSLTQNYLLDLTGQVSGIYFVEFFTTERKLFTGKVVIQDRR